MFTISECPVFGVTAVDSVNVLLTIITRTTLIVATVLVLVAGAMTIVPKYYQMKGLDQQRNELMRRVDYKSYQLKLLKDKQQRFKTDPEYVERVARMNRRVREGELVFVFDAEAAR